MNFLLHFAQNETLIVNLMQATLRPRLTYQNVVIVDAGTELVQRKNPHACVNLRQSGKCDAQFCRLKILVWAKLGIGQ